MDPCGSAIDIMISSPQYACETVRDLYVVTQSLADWSMKSGLVLAIRRYNACKACTHVILSAAVHIQCKINLHYFVNNSTSFDMT